MIFNTYLPTYLRLYINVFIQYDMRISKSLILSLAQLCLLPVNAQQHITVQELRDGYIRQYVQKEKPQDLMSNDVVAFRLTSQPLPPKGVALAYDFMENTKELRKAGKVELPPSKYIVTFDSYSRKENLRIYWVGLRDSTATEREAQVRASLTKSYGIVRLGGSVEAVPAVWVRGDVHTLHAPFYYGGFIMSDKTSFCIRMPQKGKENLGSASDETIVVGQVAKDFSDMLCRAQRGNKVFVSRKPVYEPHVVTSGALKLLARDVNALIPKGNSHVTGIKCYPLQLIANDNGMLVASPVQPESFNEEDKKLIGTLNEALQKIPSGTLWTACTIDGRPYTCANVEATYMGESGQWWFEECSRVQMK